MATPEHQGQSPSSAADDGFTSSHAFFAAILMTMFAIAIVLSIIGLTSPSWLGFS